MLPASHVELRRKGGKGSENVAKGGNTRTQSADRKRWGVNELGDGYAKDLILLAGSSIYNISLRVIELQIRSLPKHTNHLVHIQPPSNHLRPCLFVIRTQ